MPNIALYRPAISRPCGIGELGACAYRGGGGGGGGADPSQFSKKYLSPPCLSLDQSCWWDIQELLFKYDNERYLYQPTKVVKN